MLRALGGQSDVSEAAHTFGSECGRRKREAKEETPHVSNITEVCAFHVDDPPQMPQSQSWLS
ncbi:hypothetical protein CGCSCA1_v014377 [Colletotrichum siamense]|uniref:uncharacterized protein n=1 Tax=Colletotrichum siamense TaxID=690259 RepID=UPI00187266A8|nr:uncharacterized protein CGCS363_v000783 [Colletotrichum siamense]KAF4864226.1 hypothetical protein CGCSCA1_v014377 [Colletotrichum siamense]KAF5515740.1 hypothetical protein CGCS363_v000783 [Colletotrichum siamense]